MSIFYTIYKITNKLNGKFYIGQHATNNLHCSYMGSGTSLLEDQKKYGIENFSKEILFVYNNFYEMNNKEIELVDKELVENTKSYNSMPGGSGVKSIKIDDDLKKKFETFYDSLTEEEFIEFGKYHSKVLYDYNVKYKARVDKLTRQECRFVNVRKRKMGFVRVAEEYYALHIESKNIENFGRSQEIKLEMQELLEMSDTLNYFMETVDIDFIKAYGFKEKTISKIVKTKNDIKLLKIDMIQIGYKKGTMKSYDEIERDIDLLFNKYHSTYRPKKTVLKEWFVIDEYMKNGLKYYEIMGDK